MSERWSLYIDESGSFGAPDAERPTAESVVSGLLLRDGESQAAAERIRSRLEAIWAPIPWPPHAAFLAWPVALPLAFGLHRPAHVPAFLVPEAELFFRASAALARALPDTEAATLAATLASCRLPRPGVLAWLDAGLRDHLPGRDAAALREALALRHRATRKLLSDIRTACGGHAYVIAGATWEPYPDNESVGDGAVVRDPYVRTLERLLERACALLADAASPKPRLIIRVLTRRIARDPRIGDPELRRGQPDILLRPRGELTRSAVEEIFTRACGVPRLRDSVVIDVRGQPNRFDEHVHPMLVLADYVALRVRWTVPRETRWPHVASDVNRHLGGSGEQPWAAMPPRSLPALRLPTIANDGDERRAINYALAFRKAPEMTAPEGWPKDQAEQWIEAAIQGVSR